MQKLVQGIHFFQTNVFNAQREMFRRLAEGQTPRALFITCADSRINPNLITQTDPGDLFISRNAGNIIPPHGAADSGEAATIEYAVAALGVRHVIVCGHSRCGAMEALLEPERVRELPAVSRWLGHAEATRRIIKENYTHLEGNRRLTAAVQENVLVQLENLRTHPSVAARLGRGELTLHGWVYKLETGEVFRFDPAVGQFVPMGEPSANGSAASPLPAAAVVTATALAAEAVGTCDGGESCGHHHRHNGRDHRDAAGATAFSEVRRTSAAPVPVAPASVPAAEWSTLGVSSQFFGLAHSLKAV
jgi:carbonic anhydrase